MAEKFKYHCAFTLILCIIISITPAYCAVVNEAEIFISLKGMDFNDGSIDKPVKSFEAVKKLVKIKKQQGAKSIVVNLREGVYCQKDGLVFTKDDGGSNDVSVEYRAYNNETVSITNGKFLDGGKFKSVTDEKTLGRIPTEVSRYVKYVNLYELGITDLGTIARDGFGQQPYTSSPVLSVDTEVMTLAKWPNYGFSYTNEIKNFTQSNGVTFSYSEEKGERWATADDMWYYGFPCYDWSDMSSPITMLDTNKKELTTKYTPSYGMLSGRQYFLYNLLEELDMPGEWYIDRKTGNLFIYPKSNLESSRIILTTSKSPIISLQGAKNMTFRGITFESTCHSGVVIDKDSLSNLIEDCVFRNIGRQAVNIYGKKNGISRCKFYDLYKGGIWIDETSGDFETLMPSENYIENCSIERYSLTSMAYSAAIDMFGVGDRASHNRISNAAHLAIRFHGNNNIIEYNDIYYVLQLSEDMGAMYDWKGWTSTGHIIRYNSIHDCHGKPANPGQARHFVAGIYLDDEGSGDQMYGNIFANLEAGIYTNGGRSNVMTNNLFINCSDMFARITGWCSNGLDFLKKENALLEEALAQGLKKYNSPTVNHTMRLDEYYKCYKGTNKIWDEQYPWLSTLLSDQPFFPKYNVFSKNVAFNSPEYTHQVVLDTGTFKNNYVSHKTPEMVDPKNGNYNLVDYSEIVANVEGFEPLDITKMGIENERDLQVGEFSAVIPINGKKNVDINNQIFGWEYSDGADKYRLTIATDSEFKNKVFDDYVRQNYKVVKNLKYNLQKYFWKVEAYSSSYAFTKSNTNKNGVQSFRTVASEPLYYKDYNLALQKVDETLNLITVGEEAGQVSQVARDNFIKNIDDIKQKLVGKITQKDVKTAMKNMLFSIENLNALRKTQVIEIDEFLTDKSGWSNKSMETSNIVFDEKGLTVLPAVSDIAAYKNKKIETYQSIKFKARFSFENGSWVGLSIRQQNPTVYAIWGSLGYGFTISEKRIDIQYFNGGGKVIDFKDNTFIEAGKEYLIEIGAIDVIDLSNGVRVFLKVDNQIVFDYVDKAKIVPNSGYFAMMSTKANLEIMPILRIQ